VANYDKPPEWEGLLGALKTEEHEAISYLESELKTAHIEALDRYFGAPYGDEVPGRSRVTTREVFEAIEWLRPDMCRVFTSGDRIVDLEGLQQQDDQYAEEAADYLNWLFLEDAPGAELLDQFVFDGLLQRVGIIAAEWKAAEHSPLQTVQGLNTQQINALMQLPDVQIEEVMPTQGLPDEAHPDGLYYAAQIRQRLAPGKPDIFVIAPEDFRVSPRAADLETVTYCGDVMRMMRGEAQRLWPEYEEELASGTDGAWWNTDQRRAARFRDLDGSADVTLGSEQSEQIEIMREFIRYDLNDDGYPEWVRVCRYNDCILEAQEVSDHIYAAWTPVPIPHRFYGLSIADVLQDLQRVKTVLLRSMLDATYQSVVPRMAVDQNNVNLADLLVVEPGSNIRTIGPPSNSLLPIQTPDVAPSALNAMQWVDQIIETRAGVTRHAQGLDPDALNHTATGVQLLQNASNVRKEQIARNVANGLSKFFRKLYKLVVTHQDEARQVKVTGGWRSIDPRSWSADMRVRINVGLGTGARDAQLMMLQMVQADQTAWVQAFGPATPIVTPQHMYALVEEKLRVMGYRSAGKFFAEPPQGYAPEVSDPNAAKAQADMQMKQAELQLRGQEAQAQMALKTQEAQAKLTLEEQRSAAQIQSDERKTAAQIEADRERMAAELQIQREKLNAEFQLKREQMAAEFQLKREQMQMEAEIKREVGMANASAKMNGSANVGSDVRFGGEIG
jgi:hypothetical protein